MPSSYYGLVLVLLALFQDKSFSSPIHHHNLQNCSWEDIKIHARNLSDLAMTFYNTTQTKDNVLLEIPRIHCEHKCGPEALSLDKKTCLQQIHHVLSFYKNALDILTDLKDYERKNDIINIKHIISHLLHCLRGFRNKSLTTQPIEATSDFVKLKFGTPLASSSSLIARVFAVGDPSNHVLAEKQ